MALNPYDQSVYDAGYKYIPRSEFLLNPFQIPQGDENETPTGGLPTINPGGGGGNQSLYTGGITGLTTDFQKAVDARTQRLEDAYNNPSTAKIFGFPAFRQDVNPADAGFYVGEDMRIPQERTALGKMFQPQSPQEIMEQGYEPRTNIGILNAILGKADKFGTLSRPDQAFITSQMGYTGPTVFGENTTGGSKDPFGLNVRSAFGNYAERVGKEVDKLGFALSDKGKTGKKYDATFNPATGLFEGPEAELANRMTKMMRAKLSFYQKQTALRDADRKAAKEAMMKAYQESQMKQERDRIQSKLDSGGFDSTSNIPDRDRGSVTTESAAKTSKVGGGGYTKSDSAREDRRGGQYGFMDGGIVDMLEIYD